MGSVTKLGRLAAEMEILLQNALLAEASCSLQVNAEASSICTTVMDVSLVGFGHSAGVKLESDCQQNSGRLAELLLRAPSHLGSPLRRAAV
jgi:hypothetical protein